MSDKYCSLNFDWTFRCNNETFWQHDSCI